MAEDKTLKCVECGADFVYAASEQELHKSLGYRNEPKRCSPCREAKKKQRPPGGFGGGSRFGGGGFGGGGSDRPRQYFSVICAECGKESEVPFKPRGDKPVYCNDCYTKRKASM
ncbi:MAG: zinc-binding protein [Planctomycetes bacterium RBG_16_43_13]|nr:MAG: zinc-binding protein [Planctomycetes bacterium RBG_16_43_13]